MSSFNSGQLVLASSVLSGAFFQNTGGGLIFLQALKVFEETLRKSNTERQVKILACISKEAP